jgi:2-polyprenyl-3-methyl-5-hydroxy-6-metoxy-1,4-benzoquinol methylase
MKNVIKCVLCESTNLKKKQTLDIKELTNCYSKENNINVKSEFHNSDKIEYYLCKNCDLSFFYPTINGSQEFYNQIQYNHDTYYKKERPEFFKALPFISSQTSVLEIGSGDASFAKLIKPKNYLGLEYSDEAIRKAEKDNISLKKLSIEEFSAESENYENYDIVCSFHVLEHVENPRMFISSCLEVLKKGGKLILAVPCRNSILTNNLNHTLNLPPHHLSRWSSKSFKKLTQLFGISLIELFIDDLEEKRYKTYFDFLWAKRINKLYKPEREVLDYSSDYFRLIDIVKRVNRRFKLFKVSNKKNWVGENMMVVFEKTNK